jgi:hypothetical protein
MILSYNEYLEWLLPGTSLKSIIFFILYKLDGHTLIPGRGFLFVDMLRLSPVAQPVWYSVSISDVFCNGKSGQSMKI